MEAWKRATARDCEAGMERASGSRASAAEGRGCWEGTETEWERRLAVAVGFEGLGDVAVGGLGGGVEDMACKGVGAFAVLVCGVWGEGGLRKEREDGRGGEGFVVMERGRGASGVVRHGRSVCCVCVL